MKIKKLLVVLGVAAVATMAFVGCSSGDSAAEETSNEGIEVATSIDGVYRAEYEQADEEGFKTFLEVTVQDGTISDVNFDEVNIENNEVNTVDDQIDDVLEEVLLTATTPEEFEEMIEGQEQAEEFKVLLAQVMSQVEQGNTDTVIVNN